ncbi:MAG: S4 domain-containing protein [Candidatus Woesearchaeota archaeon]
MKRHLKRINAPKTWKVKRKGIKFITRSNPGGMNKLLTIPISNILKYDLKVATNTKEVKNLLQNKNVFVNHKAVRDYKYPVCFEDVVTINNINYRLIIGKDGILKLINVPDEESDLVIAKIIGKSYVKGKLQLNLFNGMNVFFEKQHYKVGDSLLVTLKEKIIKEHIPLEKGALVLLYKGKHVGKIGVLKDMMGSLVTISEGDLSFQTKKDYLLVIGKNKPLIKITS